MFGCIVVVRGDHCYNNCAKTGHLPILTPPPTSHIYPQTGGRVNTQPLIEHGLHSLTGSTDSED